MLSLRRHLPNQIYTGPIRDTDPISKNLDITGQLAPIEQERFRMMHGRYLGGFGELGEDTAAETLSLDPALRALEAEDDVVGSGIFDGSGATTVHATMGVFQDHPSMPGNIARNPPFTVSRDTVDLPSGAAVIEVPGGGMAYIERGGRPSGAEGGPVPPRVPFGPGALSTREEPYVMLSPQSGVRGRRRAIEHGDELVPAPNLRVAPHPTLIPRWPRKSEVPPDHPSSPVPLIPITEATLPPSTDKPIPVGFVSTVNVDVARAPISGFGRYGYGAAEEPKRSLGEYAVAGLMVGAAAAVLAGVLKKKRK